MKRTFQWVELYIVTWPCSRSTFKLRFISQPFIWQDCILFKNVLPNFQTDILSRICLIKYDVWRSYNVAIDLIHNLSRTDHELESSGIAIKSTSAQYCIHEKFLLDENICQSRRFTVTGKKQKTHKLGRFLQKCARAFCVSHVFQTKSAHHTMFIAYGETD